MPAAPSTVDPIPFTDLIAAPAGPGPRTRSSQAPSARLPFARAVVWADATGVRVGAGGWTVLIDGPDRLRRLSAVWRAAVAHRADPCAPALAWISSTFSDSSPEPSVLRVPARVVEAAGTGLPGGASAGAGAPSKPPRTLPAHMDEAALRAAVAQDAGARLLADGEVPLPADAAARAWDDAGYAAGVREVLARMAASGGRLEKAVISRTETLPATDAQLWDALEALRAAYPQTWVFAVGGLMGATPEMLATRHHGVVTSRVLAGSLPRGADAAEDSRLRERLATDARLAGEHHWAARSVIDALAPVVELEDGQPAAEVLTLPNVHHLATSVRGRLRADGGTVLDVVAALHPTAAVGGTPREAAAALIGDVEPVDRGRYAGPVGWLDQSGDGEIALALRCGQQVPGGIRLHAGGGIVPGAVPEDEVAEVAVKLMPMRRALGRR